jgi:hypothetical protein
MDKRYTAAVEKRANEIHEHLLTRGFVDSSTVGLHLKKNQAPTT